MLRVAAWVFRSKNLALGVREGETFIPLTNLPYDAAQHNSIDDFRQASSVSTDNEVDLYSDPDGYRLAVFRGWLELRLTRDVNRAFGESIWKAANNSD